MHADYILLLCEMYSLELLFYNDKQIISGLVNIYKFDT